MARFSKPKMTRRISKGMTSTHETGTSTYFEIWQTGFNKYILRVNARAKKGVYRDVHIHTSCIPKYFVYINPYSEKVEWIEIPIHLTGDYHVDCVYIENILLGLHFTDQEGTRCTQYKNNKGTYNSIYSKDVKVTAK